MPVTYISTVVVEPIGVRQVSKSRVSIADDGGVRSQDLADKNAYELVPIHPLLTIAKMDDLLTFYTDNRTETIRVTAGDGREFDCVWMGDYALIRSNGLRRTMRGRLRGNLVV